MGHSDQGTAGPRSGKDPLAELLLAPSDILEGLPDAVVAAGTDGRIVFVNALAEKLFGHPREKLIGRPVQMLWPEPLRERYTRNMQLYFAAEHPLRFTQEAWGLRRDGSEFEGEMAWGIVESTGGPLLLAIGRDITERRAAEARLRAVAAMGERALAGADPVDLAAEAVGVMRAALPIDGAEVRLTRSAPVAAVGDMTRTALRVSIGERGELRVSPRDELTDEEISFVRAVANTLATALARLRDEERMRHDAVHDPLTGLPNRTLLRDRLQHALARSVREGSATGVLFVDLDNFKRVNDIHGHATGDAVLTELGRRLLTAVRPADTVARLGGDEFVVVCERIDTHSAIALGRRLQEAMRVPFAVRGVEYGLSASIGIAVGDGDSDALLDDADAAVYRAKAHGRGRLELFR